MTDPLEAAQDMAHDAVVFYESHQNRDAEWSQRQAIVHALISIAESLEALAHPPVLQAERAGEPDWKTRFAEVSRIFNDALSERKSDAEIIGLLDGAFDSLGGT